MSYSVSININVIKSKPYYIILCVVDLDVRLEIWYPMYASLDWVIIDLGNNFSPTWSQITWTNTTLLPIV